MQVREMRAGEEAALHAVFHSAVHRLACRDYTPEQLDAWAPSNRDPDEWARRIAQIRPFVVETAGEIVGYADLQPDGYINHFFVSGAHARRGVGTLMIEHILRLAGERALAALSSDVSRTAQPLFERFGFRVVEQRFPVVGGVTLCNALMRKDLAGRAANPRATGVDSKARPSRAMLGLRRSKHRGEEDGTD
ncbi:MAG: GNAT family N-acetyltransferase [Burkholderiaceae bacterium]|nr:GNAT family N-acetyltransferase [Burkholderiaceae bacterium]